MEIQLRRAHIVLIVATSRQLGKGDFQFYSKDLIKISWTNFNPQNSLNAGFSYHLLQDSWLPLSGKQVIYYFLEKTYISLH